MGSVRAKSAHVACTGIYFIFNSIVISEAKELREVSLNYQYSETLKLIA